MKTAVINIKTDEETKENAKLLAHELGLPLSTVVNSYLRDFIRKGKFSVSRIPIMTPSLERLLGKVEEDLKKGHNLSPEFSTTEEMDEYLDTL